MGNATGGEIRTFIKQKLFDIQEQRLSKRNLLPFENFQSNLELSYGPAPLLPETASLMVAPLIERSVCFEFCNKSEDYCCLKVVTRPNPIPTDMSESQFSIYWEVPRPDYVVLPPNSKVHGYFPDSVGRIELIILEENLLSKTNRAKSVSVEAANDPERVRLKRKPLCAYVSSFTQFSVFQISRFAQRVVYLKYKGRGENMKSILEPRLGAGEDSRPVHEIDFLISISYQFLFRSALFIRKLVEKVCSSWSRMDDPSVEAFPNVSQEDIQFATSSWECF